MSLPIDYRDYFVRGLHDALSGHTSSNVAEAVRFSEQSNTRCIGLTIETRPDYCLGPHLEQVPSPTLTICAKPIETGQRRAIIIGCCLGSGNLKG